MNICEAAQEAHAQGKNQICDSDWDMAILLRPSRSPVFVLPEHMEGDAYEFGFEDFLHTRWEVV